MITRFESYAPLPDYLHGSVLALGNFDGFHKGHQAVIAEAVRWAKAMGRPAIVATFDPHPLHFLNPDTPGFCLTNLDQREELFTKAGAAAMLAIHFDRAMADMSAARWITEILHRRFKCFGVVTGEDFRFGRGRSGTGQTLRDVGGPLGIAYRPVSPVTDGDEIVSSTRIREALKLGDCEAANRLLTRPYVMRAVARHFINNEYYDYTNFEFFNSFYFMPRPGNYRVTAKMPDGIVRPGNANLAEHESAGVLELYSPAKLDHLNSQMIEIAFHCSSDSGIPVELPDRNSVSCGVTPPCVCKVQHRVFAP